MLYVVHDITDQLAQGANVVGVTLGNGWYSNHKHFTEFGKWGDSPRLLLQINIEFADGSTMSVASDETWKVSTGPILRNDLYGGEIYDARLEKPGWATAAYDDSGWDRAVVKKPPGGKLQSQLMPAIKVIEVMKPVKLTNPKPGVYVYDLGQVFAGWARLHVKGPAGTKVTIRYSERILDDSGLLDERIFCYPGLKSTDEYILKGDPRGEVYAPTFAFHPVRYVQIEGYPGTPTLSDLEGVVVHGAEDLSGDFHCSNELLNQIHRNAVWTLGNVAVRHAHGLHVPRAHLLHLSVGRLLELEHAQVHAPVLDEVAARRGGQPGRKGFDLGHCALLQHPRVRHGFRRHLPGPRMVLPPVLRRRPHPGRTLRRHEEVGGLPHFAGAGPYSVQGNLRRPHGAGRMRRGRRSISRRSRRRL